jgi:hypothetical protein
LLYRLLHLDGYDVLPLGAHFAARGGDKGHAPIIARAKRLASEAGVRTDWIASARDATAALAWNAASRRAQVGVFGAYVADVAGAIAVRRVLAPELFDEVAGTWLDLAEPWGHVAARMPALLGRIEGLTQRDAEALAATGRPPNPRLIWVEAHMIDREFLFNSAALTGRWRAWRAAARATLMADGVFREADYSGSWPPAAEIAGNAAVALAFEPLLGPDSVREVAGPWRSVMGEL